MDVRGDGEVSWEDFSQVKATYYNPNPTFAAI